jgi:hypothetical protein
MDIPKTKWFGKVSAKSMWLTARRQTQAKPELRRGLATKLLAAATSENDSNHFGLGINDCEGLVLVPPLRLRYTLQKYNYATGLWSSTSQVIYAPNNTFPNVSHGTYRVRVDIPTALTNLSCDGGLIYAINGVAQHIGYIGSYSGLTTSSNYSNEVIVGATTPQDIDISFIDEPETGPVNAYDYGEVVTLDMSSCKNYNLFWIAIFEDGGQNRYNTMGWEYGPVSEKDLTDVWTFNHPGWNFEVFTAYDVQISIENNRCKNNPWNVEYETFFVCPTGTGCRLVAKSEMQEIVLAPNPASEWVQLQNFQREREHHYRVLIVDAYGRSIYTATLMEDEEAISLASVPAGMYALQVWEDDRMLFADKLIVQK